MLSTLGVLEQYAGSVPRAAELLADAAELAEGPLRVWALAELGGDPVPAQRPGRPRRRSADRIAEVADLGDPGQRVLADFVRGVPRGWSAATRHAGRRLLAASLELLESEPSLRDDPRYLIPWLLGGRASWATHVRGVGPGPNAAWPRRASAAPWVSWSPGWP